MVNIIAEARKGKKERRDVTSALLKRFSNQTATYITEEFVNILLTFFVLKKCLSLRTHKQNKSK